jgi:adenosylhomocysteinase
MLKFHKRMKPEVIAVPEKLDMEIARLKLRTLGLKIDVLTPEQKKYLASWQEGT